MTDDVHQQMRRVQQSAVFEDLAGHYSRGGGGLASNFNSTHASMLKSYLQEHVEEEWPFSMRFYALLIKFLFTKLSVESLLRTFLCNFLLNLATIFSA